MGLFDKRSRAERDAAESLKVRYEFTRVGLRELAQLERTGDTLASSLGRIEAEMMIGVETVLALPPSKYRDELSESARLLATQVHQQAVALGERGGVDEEQLRERTLAERKRISGRHR